MKIQQTKNLCQKQTERNTIKAFLDQHKIQGTGKKICAVVENSKTLDRKTGT